MRQLQSGRVKRVGAEGAVHKRLGDMLRDSGIVDEVALETALEIQKRSGERLGTTLVRLHLIDQDRLAQLLGEQLGVAGVDPAQLEPEPDAVGLLSLEDAMRLGCLPLWRRGDRLVVAMSDPTDATAVEELRRLTGLEPECFVAPQMSLYDGVKRAYQRAVEIEGGEGLDRRAALRGAVGRVRDALAQLEAMLDE